METCATSIVSKVFLGSLMVMMVSLAILSAVAVGAFVVGVMKVKFMQ